MARERGYRAGVIIVIRTLQAFLILAALAAGIATVAMAVEVVGNANAKCSLPYTSEERGAPSAGCGGMGKFQAEATTTLAIALAGLTTMMGAVALNGMVPRERPARAQPAFGAPPTGPGAQFGPGGPALRRPS